jgi:microcystin-dependent protein
VSSAPYFISGQGWVKCDGSAVSRSLYSALFSLVGTAFGVGDNINTFNLPNAGGKVLGTVDATHARGLNTGSENHILTTGELPAHSHTYQDAYFAENYSGKVNSVYGTGSGTDTDNGFYYRDANGSYSTNPQNLNTGNGPGSATPFSVMQPTLFIGNTFIYTGVV